MSSVRKATPADIPFIGSIILEAEATGHEITSYRKMFASLSQETLSQKIRMALHNASNGHSMSYKTYFVAEFEGRPAAALSAYVEGEFGDSGQLAIGTLMTVFSRDQVREAIEVLKQSPEILIPKTKGSVQIDCVATLPDYRGKGLLKSILGHVESRYPGYSKEIQVWKKNRNALNAYQKLGYTITTERISLKDNQNGKVLMTKK